jgi:hypothetical protein
MIDYTKLINKLVPQTDGEDVVRLRKGQVDTVNADGTVDLILSGVVVPDVPRLAGAPMVAGTNVQVLVYRGSLLVLGPVSASTAPLQVISTHHVAASGAVAPITNTAATPTGLSITFTTYTANAVAMVELALDLDPTNTTLAIVIGFLALNGVDIPLPQIVYENPTTMGRVTLVRTYRVPIPTPGSHTIVGKVQRAVGSGNISALATNSTLTATVYQSA